MLSKYSHGLAYLMAALYALLGLPLFFFPEPLSAVFAWKVTPFITMTIGGWCLGNAWMAFITARRWQWHVVYTALIYLWSFGAGESIVLFIFWDKVKFESPIAWLYIFTLIVNAAAALLGFFEWLRIRPALESNGERIQPIHRVYAVAFVIFVGFLGLYGIIAQIGSVGTNGGIFPEIMSSFTLRSFGVFYFSIALASIPHIWGKSLQPVSHHAFASYGLIVFITIAAFVYIRLFDFAQRPGGLLYIGVYLIVGIPLLFTFRKFGTGAS
jgi:hypothetical protein